VNHYKLDDTPKPITGYYATGSDPAQPARLCLGTNAFAPAVGAATTPPAVPAFHFPAPGTIINTNTAEAFRDLDKKAVLDKIGQGVWDDIVSGRAVKQPWLLARFLVLTFADLKKYKYKYWFAFPALVPANPFNVSKTSPIGDSFTAEQQTALCTQYELFRGLAGNQGDLANAAAVAVRVNNKAGLPQVLPLSDFIKGDYVLFADASALPSHPGWFLRNLLVLLKVHFKLDHASVSVVFFLFPFICGYCFSLPLLLQVIAYREQRGKNNISQSIVLDVDLASASDLLPTSPPPKVLGWEKNEQDKAAPRFMDLAAMMDPKR